MSRAILQSLTRGRVVVWIEIPPPSCQRLYQGVRTADGAEVWVCSHAGPKYLLPPRLELRDHSPAGAKFGGLEWGYCGTGAAQLALALLAHVVGDELAKDFYQDFKCDIVAGMAEEGWQLSDEEIEAWVEARLRKGGVSL